MFRECGPAGALPLIGGDEPEQVLIEGGNVHTEGVEKFPVNGFDEENGLCGEGAALFGDGEGFGAGIGRMRIPQNQPFFFEGAENIGGHHHIHFGVGSQFNLGDRVFIARKPGQGREEDELGVREAKRAQPRIDLPLPETGHLPKGKTRTLVRGGYLKNGRIVRHGGFLSREHGPLLPMGHGRRTGKVFGEHPPGNQVKIGLGNFKKAKPEEVAPA